LHYELRIRDLFKEINGIKPRWWIWFRYRWL